MYICVKCHSYLINIQIRNIYLSNYLNVDILCSAVMYATNDVSSDSIEKRSLAQVHIY